MIEKKQRKVKFDNTVRLTPVEAYRGRNCIGSGALKIDAAEPWNLPEIVIFRPTHGSHGKKTKTAEMPATDLADYLARKAVPFRYW